MFGLDTYKLGLEAGKRETILKMEKYLERLKKK